jgi:hypothetical protein
MPSATFRIRSNGIQVHKGQVHEGLTALFNTSNYVLAILSESNACFVTQTHSRVNLRSGFLQVLSNDHLCPPCANRRRSATTAPTTRIQLDIRGSGQLSLAERERKGQGGTRSKESRAERMAHLAESR